MGGDGGVAGEGRIFGLPKFHSWAKCTMPLTKINSDWMSMLPLINTSPLRWHAGHLAEVNENINLS